MVRDKRQDRRLKEKEALFTSHSLYVDYLKLCLDNPELEIYDITYRNPTYSSQNKKEFIVFEILFAYLESAYHYYQDQSDIIKTKRWAGWISFIKGYFKQENFKNAWKLTAAEWDKDFGNFMNVIMNEQSFSNQTQEQKRQSI